MQRRNLPCTFHWGARKQASRRAAIRSIRWSIIINMGRTFETSHPVRISPQQFLELQMDEGFDQAMAALEDCILQTSMQTQQSADEESVVHRLTELELKSNPVPPLLRGILGSAMEELLTGKIKMEQTVYPRRASEAHAKETKTMLPGKLSDVIQIESQQWMERASDTECLLRSRHTICCSLFGIASMVENEIEKGIRDNYNNMPAKMEAFVQGGVAALGKAASGKESASPRPSSGRGARPIVQSQKWSLPELLLGDLFGCCASRRPRRVRVSFAGDVSMRGEALSPRRDRTLSGRELAVGRPRVISVTLEHDEAEPATPRLAFDARDALDARARSRTVSVSVSAQEKHFIVHDTAPFFGSRAWQCFGPFGEAVSDALANCAPRAPPQLLTADAEAATAM